MNKKELLFISVGVFLTIVAWLIADIYHTSTTKKIKFNTDLPIIKEYHFNERILKILQKKNP